MHTKEELAYLNHLETRLALCDAFEELMKTESIDKISVSKICQQAGVSRATFYRIFQDKFEVVQWAIRYVHSKGADLIGKELTWEEGFYESEIAIVRHLDFFREAAKSTDYNSLDLYTPRTRKAVLCATVTDCYHQKLTPKMLFMIDAAVNAETTMLPCWHRGEYDCTLREMCSWVTECIPKELYELLKEPLSKQNDPANFKHFLLGKGF